MTALIISMNLKFFAQNFFLYLHRNICSAKQRENQEIGVWLWHFQPFRKAWRASLGV